MWAATICTDYLESSGNCLLLNLNPPLPCANLHRRTLSLTLLMASIKAANPLTGRKVVDVSMATPRCEKAGSSRMKTCGYRGTDFAVGKGCFTSGH